MLLKFSQQTFQKKKIPQISNLGKISPVGAEFFSADRRTDRETDTRL